MATRLAGLSAPEPTAAAHAGVLVVGAHHPDILKEVTMKSTVADSVLRALRARYGGMTDAELASLLRKRHQHINQTCRALVGQGLITRDSTSNGIINRAIGDAAPQRAATAGTTADRDWTWEGNVQSRIAAHLAASGWTIISTADTASRERGADIIAQRAGRQMLVEVKGWPRGTARTQPTLQATHYFAGALTTLIRRGGSARLAIGLPDMPRYRSLLSEAAWALGRLGITAYLVTPDGTIRPWDGTECEPGEHTTLAGVQSDVEALAGACGMPGSTA